MTDNSPSHLEHLFDAELRYQDGMPPIVTQHENVGALVGSGTGHVAGPHLRGALRWSNFERTLPDHCQLTLAGEIETEAGGVIRFDARGFALPPAGGSAGPWRVAAALRFAAQDPGYRWLDALPAIWQGQFDEATATARYRAYVPTDASGKGS